MEADEPLTFGSFEELAAYLAEQVLLDNPHLESCLNGPPGHEMMLQFRLFRGAKLLSATEVANRLGWSLDKVHEFEHAHFDDVLYLELLAYLRAIGVPVDIDVVDKDTKEVMASLT